MRVDKLIQDKRGKAMRAYKAEKQAKGNFFFYYFIILKGPVC